jgi:serine/threonine protein kinase
MKELKHPNVVELKQVFMTENNCYIVMDYCDGGDMARLLRGRGRLPES